MYRPKERSVALESFKPCSLGSICSENKAFPSKGRSWTDCCTSLERLKDCSHDLCRTDTADAIDVTIEWAVSKAA